jgi:hypothetical protein
VTRRRADWRRPAARTQAARAMQNSAGAPRPRPEPPRLRPQKSRFGFAIVSEETMRRPVPLPGPGNRKIPMTLAPVNLPPAYEEDE